MNNHDWYFIDKERDRFVITEKAPEEVSTLNNRLSDLKNQIKKKKHAILEHKHSQQPIFAQLLWKATIISTFNRHIECNFGLAIRQ